MDEANSADESTAQPSNCDQEEEIVNFHKLIPGRIYSHGPSSLRSVQQQLGHLVQAQEDEMGRALLSHHRQHEPIEVRCSILFLVHVCGAYGWEGDHAAVQQQAASADGLCQLGDSRVELVPSVSAAAVHINRLVLRG